MLPRLNTFTRYSGEQEEYWEHVVLRLWHIRLHYRSNNLSFGGTDKERTLELSKETRFYMSREHLRSGYLVYPGCNVSRWTDTACQGKFQEFKGKSLSVLENYLPAFGEHHPRTMDMYGGIAGTLSGLESYKEAESYF